MSIAENVIIMIRPFEGILGNTCELRLLEFLLPLNDMEFNITELSEETGVNRVTAGRVAKKFVEWGILNASNDKIVQYSINQSSPIVQSIEIFNNALIGRILGDEKIKEIRDHLKRHKLEKYPPETDISDGQGWSYIPDMTEKATAWGAGDICSVGVTPNAFSQDFPHATAERYGIGHSYSNPDYIQ